MTDDLLLLNPGPVPIDRRVRAAMDAPMISRRSDEFGEIYERARDGLRTVFMRSTPDGSATATGGTTLLLNGTATMGMEAAIANLTDPDSEVLALVNGQFGERFATIAEGYATVRRVEAEWGTSFDLADVETAIDGADLVTMVHDETSTGLSNPVGAVGRLVAERDALFVVDGVSSIGGEEFRIDDWGVDVAVTDPQKALASPPGISALYLSDAAIKALDDSHAPTYQNLVDYLDAAADRRTPYTAASPQIRALAVALDLIDAEGMPARIERHRRWAETVRESVRAMGLEPFADPVAPSSYANTLTAVSFPDGVRGVPERVERFDTALAERNVSVGGGLGHLDGHLFRVSNMGAITPAQLRDGLRAIGESLDAAGADVDVAAGVAVADERLSSDPETGGE